MITSIRLLSVLVLLVYVASAHAKAPQNRKFVIAASVFGSHNSPTYNGFKIGMQELGYVDGQNATYLFNGVYKDKSEVDPDLQSMISQKPDLIFTATTLPSIAAKKATAANNIPVVFGPVQNPVDAGLMSDLKHPGGNMTGVMLTDSTAKQLEWALRIIPTIKRVLIPYNPNDPSSFLSFRKAQEASTLFNLEIVPQKVTRQSEIDILINHFPENIDLIFLPRDAMVMLRVADFAKVAHERRIVLTGTRYEMPEKGALFGFGFSGFEVGRQAARMADQVLNGMKPGDLPVETAEDYLAINLAAAQAKGIKISEHILRQAHMIIRPEPTNSSK